MTTRLGWVLEGLRTGVVTTHYPTHPDPAATGGVRTSPRAHPERCRADSGCEDCIRACLPRALSLLAGGAAAQADGDGVKAQPWRPEAQAHTTLVLDLGKCIGCGLCAQVCPHDAFDMVSDVELATRNSALLRQLLPLAITDAPNEVR